MSFQHGLMLIGLIAVAVPIIIHLLNRSRAKLLDWGAMRFLLASLTSQNRRILVEEIILLALRCLLVALIVMAVARPFLPTRPTVPIAIVLPAALAAAICLGVAGAMWAFKRARWALLAATVLLAAIAIGASAFERWIQLRLWVTGKGERDVAILIDGSMSMTLRVEGRTNFERAVEEARSVVEACRPGDAVSLILAGPVPRAVIATPSPDREEIGAALEEIKPVGGTMNVLEALNAAAASLADGNNVAKKIVLITDGQNVGWDVRSEARWRFLAEGLKGLPAKPRIICRILPLPDTLRNAAVAEVDFSRKVVGTDRSVKIHVKVMNTGSAPIKPSAVELSVDGVKVATERIVTDIEPKASETVGFSHRFTRPGPRLVSARIVGTDDLAADDTASRVLNVIDRLDVLIVDGTPSTRPLGGAAAFIDIALTPRRPDDEPEEPEEMVDDGEPAESEGPEEPKKKGKKGEAEEVRYLVEPKVVAAAEIASVASLSDYAVIILANVPRLPNTVCERLVGFVQSGGGLLIAPGTRVKPTFYNAWTTKAGEPILPARLDERRMADDDPARLEPKSFSHPALKLVANAGQSDATLAQIKSYWKLAADEQDSDVRVGGRLQTGEPFLVERKLGKGYVMMTAAALDPTASNLPALKAFVPLCHELVYHLASPMMLDANVAPGSEAILELRDRPDRGDDPARAKGLQAEYFDSHDLTSLKATRIDPTVNFEWGEGSPLPALGRDRFSVRWTGWVRPRYSERHTFHFMADDGVRLWVDGQRIIDAWRTQNPTEYRGETALTADRRYTIKIEYFESTGGAAAKLSWSSPSQRKEIVPSSRLVPSAPKAPATTRSDDASRAEVVTPTQRRRPAKLAQSNGLLRVSFGETQEPGIYTLVLPPGLAETFAPTATGGVPFVVLGKVEESFLEPLSQADLDLAGQHVDLFETERTDELTAAVAGGVPGEELWKYLAISALLILIGEIAVTRWVAIRRRLHAAETVTFGADAADVQTFRDRARELLALPPQSAGRGSKP